jgi:lipopolysaccharide transport protein LptA|tara:strand:- start:12002 stop:12592 length:591 start_codon:yes stop_codon:yes gene_type:complete
MENLIIKNINIFLFFVLQINIGLSQEPIQKPILLDAESSVIDRISNSVSFIKLEINQENNFIIQADEAIASSLDFSSNEWVLKGNVYLELNEMNIKAQKAVIKFSNNGVEEAIFEGLPAIFSNVNNLENLTISGGADNLTYNKKTSFISMNNNAFLKKGKNEFQGCSLIYDIDAEQITSGTSDCGTPVSITIAPSE